MTRSTDSTVRTVRQLPPDAAITRFSGPWRFLSNFYPSPLRVVIPVGESSLSISVDTVEHAYQASKAPSIEIARTICHAASPALARKMGRSITPHVDWKAERVATMRWLIALKFAETAAQVLLAENLVATGDRDLVEGNTWGDRFWGQVFVPGAVSPEATVGRWVGENWLGKILMERRAALRGSR